MKRLLKVLTLAITAGVLAFSCAEQKDSRGYIVKVGDKAPDVEFITPNNETVKLSDLKGKVVMMQFTATWCSVCIKEMPHIESEIWQKLKDNKDFALYGLMYKQKEEDITTMRKLTQVTYPLSIDDKGTFFHKYAEEGAGVTRNVIVDKDGKIAFMTRLYNEEEFNSMIGKINELLK